MRLRRDTPGIFEVFADDLDELASYPNRLTDIGSCEPEEFALMNLPDVGVLGKIISDMFIEYGEDSDLTYSYYTANYALLIVFDCRQYLK